MRLLSAATCGVLLIGSILCACLAYSPHHSSSSSPPPSPRLSLSSSPRPHPLPLRLSMYPSLPSAAPALHQICPGCDEGHHDQSPRIPRRHPALLRHCLSCRLLPLDAVVRLASQHAGRCPRGATGTHAHVHLIDGRGVHEKERQTGSTTTAPTILLFHCPNQCQIGGGEMRAHPKTHIRAQ